MNTLQFVMSVLDWLQASPANIVVAANVIALATPTPNPNTPLGRVYKIVDLLALNVLHAKETGVNTATVAEEVAQIFLAKQKAAAPAAPIVTPPAA